MSLTPPPEPLYGNMPSGEGSLLLSAYDAAMFEALGAKLLPFPNPADEPLLRRPLQQVLIPGVCGPGHKDPTDPHGRVVVVFQNPEDIYNRYLLPGLRLNRSAMTTDTQRLYPTGLGWQYRVPVTRGTVPVHVDGDASAPCGPPEVALRPWANPENLTYDIEVRARYQIEAQRLLDYVRYQLPERGAIRVYSTDGTSSLFTYYRQGISETSELAGSLNRHTGFLLTYEVQAEIDEHEEQTAKTLIKTPQLNSQLKTATRRSRVIREW
jgi:hypothetical protein